MLKKILPPLFFLFMFSCNTPTPPVNTVKTKAPVKHKTIASKPAPGYWNVMTYPVADSSQAVKKYVKTEADGSFTNSTSANNYLDAVFIVDKANAGILLHLYKKTNPAAKLTGSVNIKMKDSAGNMLEITSSRGWNKSGGISIERNNNDYSRLRIFLLQSQGVINVAIRDDASSVYNFDINMSGFGDAFGKI